MEIIKQKKITTEEKIMDKVCKESYLFNNEGHFGTIDVEKAISLTSKAKDEEWKEKVEKLKEEIGGIYLSKKKVYVSEIIGKIFYPDKNLLNQTPQEKDKYWSHSNHNPQSATETQVVNDRNKSVDTHAEPKIQFIKNDAFSLIGVAKKLQEKEKICENCSFPRWRHPVKDCCKIIGLKRIDFDCKKFVPKKEIKE